MALWQRLPADCELHLLFLGTGPDCISQPPLRLGVALWPPLNQRSRELRSGPLPGLACKTLQAQLSVPFPSLLASAEVPVTQEGSCRGTEGVPAPELLSRGGLADGQAHLSGTLHKQGVNIDGI